RDSQHQSGSQATDSQRCLARRAFHGREQVLLAAVLRLLVRSGLPARDYVSQQGFRGLACRVRWARWFLHRGMLMAPMRLLLFTALGLAGFLVFAGTASAMSDDETPPKEPPEPAPKPSGGTPAGVPAACQDAFNRWSSLANQALAACQRAANLADEWWVWEEYRLAGEYSYDPAYHEQIRRDWQAAQANCDSVNAASINAMHEYEACV